MIRLRALPLLFVPSPAIPWGTLVEFTDVSNPNVRVIVPLGAGGAMDSLARIVAGKLQERLGKPFEQVENAQTRAKEGTGLGLALVKSLDQMHGGVAAIESVLGEGTTVTVRLPHAAVDNKGERLATGKVLPFKAVS